MLRIAIIVVVAASIALYWVDTEAPSVGAPAMEAGLEGPSTDAEDPDADMDNEREPQDTLMPEDFVGQFLDFTCRQPAMASHLPAFETMLD